MTEALIILGILLGGLLFGGGIVLGVWLGQVASAGAFPRLFAPKPAPPQVATPPTNGSPYTPPPHVPFHPPPAPNPETPYRYGARTPLESADNFERLQEQLRRQSENPMADAYEAGQF